MPNDDIEDGFVEISLGGMHYVRKPGEGRKLLLLHGIGSTVQTWGRFMDCLEGFDTYAVDLLGHGKSAKPNIDYTIEAQASAVREFIGKRCSGDLFIMGHSYGAWIALQCAGSGRGLVLEDGAILNEYDMDMTSEEAKNELLEELLQENENDKRIMESIIREYKGMTEESLNDVKLPTLVLWGADDDVIDVKAAHRLHELIRGSRLAIIDGAAHVPHFSHAKEAAAETTKFINGVKNEDQDSV
jgi:pimeloyl-ACP methyl ester carboxylesterase